MAAAPRERAAAPRKRWPLQLSAETNGYCVAASDDDERDEGGQRRLIERRASGGRSLPVLRTFRSPPIRMVPREWAAQTRHCDRTPMVIAVARSSSPEARRLATCVSAADEPIVAVGPSWTSFEPPELNARPLDVLPHEVGMEVVAPRQPSVLPAVSHVLAVVDAARVVDPVPLKAVDDVVDLGEAAPAPTH